MFKKIIVYLTLFSLCFLPAVAQSQRKLSNPNSSKETEDVYCYLLQTYGLKTLSAQQLSGNTPYELEYIKANTDKQPAILGLNLTYDSLNSNVISKAIEWSKKGGLVSIMWSMLPPAHGNNLNFSTDTAFFNKIFETGTPENLAFWSDLK